MRILYIVEVSAEYHWIIIEWKKMQIKVKRQNSIYLMTK